MAKSKPTVISKSSAVKNGALPRVPVIVEGHEYFLEYDFNAIAKAEEMTGLNLFSSFDFTHLSVTKFRAMLYASLLKAQPDITVEEAGHLVTYKTLAMLTIKMVEAWHGSRPEVKEDEGNAQAEGIEETSQN